MKITVNNLIEEYPKLDINLPKGLNKDDFEYVKQAFEFYYDEDGAELKEIVDTFIEKLNQHITKSAGSNSKQISLFLPEQQKEEVSKGDIKKSKVTKIEKVINSIPGIDETREAYKLYKKEGGKNLYVTWVQIQLHIHNTFGDWFILEWNNKDKVYCYEVGNRDLEMGKYVEKKLSDIIKLNAEIDFDWNPVSLATGLKNTFPEHYKKNNSKGNEGSTNISIPPQLKQLIPGEQIEELQNHKNAKGIIENLVTILPKIPNEKEASRAYNSFSKEYPDIEPNNFLTAYLRYSTTDGDEYYVLGWDKHDTISLSIVTDADTKDGVRGNYSLKGVLEDNPRFDLNWKPKSLQQAHYNYDRDNFEKPLTIKEVDKLKNSKKSGTKQKASSSRKKAPAEKVTQVEHFTIEEKFLKRYLNLHKKEKTKNQVLTFIKALQKAIVEKQIRKTSKYAKDIEHIQKELIKIYKMDTADSFTITLEEKPLIRLEKLFQEKKERLSVNYVKRFINFYGKQTKEKAERLLNLIVKAFENGTIAKNDPYYKRVKATEKALQEYLDNKDISITASELRGLAGCVGLVAPTVKLNMPVPYKDTDLVPSTELKKRRFPRLGIKGKWKKVFGNLGTVFHIMIFGQGGKGKSTMTLDFAHYLCSDVGLKVLYIADEEKQGDTFKLKLEHLNAYDKNLVVTGVLPKSVKGFDVIVLDSVTSMGISPDELKEIQDKNKGLSTIYINQTNKKGEFYGLKKWEHLCSTMIRYEDGELEVKKNRFGEIGIHTLKYYN